MKNGVLKFSPQFFVISPHFRPGGLTAAFRKAGWRCFVSSFRAKPPKPCTFVLLSVFFPFRFFFKRARAPVARPPSPVPSPRLPRIPWPAVLPANGQTCWKSPKLVTLAESLLKCCPPHCGWSEAVHHSLHQPAPPLSWARFGLDFGKGTNPKVCGVHYGSVGRDVPPPPGPCRIQGGCVLIFWQFFAYSSWLP